MMPNRRNDSEPFHIMLSASGRRVALMRLLEESLVDLGLSGQVIATDITQTSPTMQLAENAIMVPPYRDPKCLDTLIELCDQRNIKLIVPTIDTELAFYAEHRQRFEDAGTFINISSPETISICNDKLTTHQWLVESGLPTVHVYSAAELSGNLADLPYPLFTKPSKGSSSIGANTVEDEQELEASLRSGGKIVQSLARGEEHTVDVFIDRRGVCRCTVPRRRIETRGGEVSKGITKRHAGIQTLAKQVAESLPGAFGVLNIQVFHDQETDEMNIIEVNPRFGGGYPLSHEAGAPMSRWLIEEIRGEACSASPDGWRDGLVMLRYDDAVFVSRTDIKLDEA